VALSVYLLCSITALGCAVLLFRGYRTSGARLLLWSAICFAFFTVSNALVAVDLIVLPDIDLFALRNGTALVGVSSLLYGLVWKVE
jgi:hypothetical protein